MKHTVPIILIIILTGACYVNVLSGEFVVDDPALVSENPAIRSLMPVTKFFLDPQVLSRTGEIARHSYRPLMALSFAINYQLFGLNPVGYHLTNIILHVLNGLFLYFVILRLRDDQWLATAAALLFALHPVQTEAVSYISARGDVLSLFWGLLALWFFLKQWDRPDRRWGWCLSVSFLAYLAALLSKEMVATLPGIFILTDAIFLARRNPREVFRRWSWYLPFFLLFVAYYAWRTSLLGRFGQMEWHAGPAKMVMTMTMVLAKYVRLLLLPVGLSFDHEVVPIAFSMDKQFLIAGAMLIVMFALLVRFRRSDFLFFGSGWFFLSLLPVMNIIPIVAWMAERFLYVPSIGFCLAIASMLPLPRGDVSWARRKGGFLGVVFLGALLFSYGTRTVVRNRDWQTSGALWHATVKTSPRSARAHYVLGITYADAGKYEQALETFLRAEQLDPTNSSIMNDIGVTLVNLGRRGEACEAFKKAVDLEANNTEAFANLTTCYFLKRDYRAALAVGEQALALNLESDRLDYMLGVLYAQTDQPAKAIQRLERLIAKNPRHGPAHTLLAHLNFQAGRFRQAWTHLKDAESLGESIDQTFRATLQTMLSPP